MFLYNDVNHEFSIEKEYYDKHDDNNNRKSLRQLTKDKFSEWRTMKSFDLNAGDSQRLYPPRSKPPPVRANR